MRLDHVVIWAEDPVRTVEFFEEIVGFAPVRLDEFKAKKVMFPSVRVNDDTIIDVMPKQMAPMLNGFAANSAGNLVNHVCIAMSKAEYDALAGRVERIGPLMQSSFGARGNAQQAFYFRDPDGNIFEARFYAD
jgi:glyoxylase I family protein